MVDGELEAEQAYVDSAYAFLEWMRERAQGLVAAADPKDLDLLHALRRRAASLRDTGRPLCFGRIDFADGPSFHVGRRHVEDHDGDPVVIEWRAPIAVPFYRANPADPMGLGRRRQFVIDGRAIESMADDLFGTAVGSPEVPRLRGGDALLAELERSRGAEMLDIVATIQAEQDEVIRAPLPGVLVVQGGPGSGKTAVGLHRAAYLLYGNEALARQGVLVLGPNRVFLRYIAQVLPSLGEEAVVQTTVRDLAPGVRVVAADDPGAERIKGDARMAAVIAGALAAGRRPLDVDIVVPVGLRRLTLPVAVANGLASSVAGRRVPYAVGREALRAALLDAVVSLHPGAGTEEHATVERTVRISPALTAALDRLWPAVSASTLVKALLTRRSSAADGILSAAEQAALRRKPTPTESLEIRDAAIPPPAWEIRAGRPARKPKLRDPWTAGDVALLDEASHLITGEVSTYGHIVVDEAQDLSPMQLRMIGRRSPAGSVTVLGDLAQASGVWAPESWETIATHLATPEGWRLTELRLGYRSPGDVIELASRLLPVAAPNVKPTEAVRTRRGGVRVVESTPAALDGAVASVAKQLAVTYPSVAVITPAARASQIAAELSAAGLDAEQAEAGLSHRVTVVEATQAKGLEFDAVLVADPKGIVDSALDEGRGLRLLYVARSARPTQALAIVHAGDLPAALAG